MKLDVLETDEAGNPWYANGLHFTCTQCGNCCTGGPGYVWISKEEIVRLAEFLQTTPESVVEKYCRKVDGRFSLKERRTSEGLYDCVFLKEQPFSTGGIASTKKACSVYSVRPLQCRTWPFWPEILSTREGWKRAGKRCHGIDQGNRFFDRQTIESIRDAKDWPDRPPSSE